MWSKSHLFGYVEVFILIKAESIVKYYKKGPIKTEALRGVSFDVLKGEFISIVGPSGCGKSTLLYILSGIEDFDKGSLMVSNLNMVSLSTFDKTQFRAKNIGFVFQDFQLISKLNVYENIVLATVIAKVKKAKMIF